MLVSTWLAVRLSAHRTAIVSLVVELHVELSALGQLVVEADEELAVPCLADLILCLHHDTAAAVLTSAGDDGGRTRIGSGILLREVILYIVACQITVDNHAGPALRSYELGIVSGSALLELHVLERQPADVIVSSHIELNLQHTVGTNNATGLEGIEEELRGANLLTGSYVHLNTIIDLQVDTIGRSGEAVLSANTCPNGHIVVTLRNIVHCSGQRTLTE